MRKARHIVSMTVMINNEKYNDEENEENEARNDSSSGEEKIIMA